MPIASSSGMSPFALQPTALPMRVANDSTDFGILSLPRSSVPVRGEMTACEFLLQQEYHSLLYRRI